MREPYKKKEHGSKGGSAPLGMEAACVAGSNFFVLTDIVDLEDVAFEFGGIGGAGGTTVSWISGAIFKLHSVSTRLLLSSPLANVNSCLSGATHGICRWRRPKYCWAIM